MEHKTWAKVTLGTNNNPSIDAKNTICCVCAFQAVCYIIWAKITLGTNNNPSIEAKGTVCCSYTIQAVGYKIWANIATETISNQSSATEKAISCVCAIQAVGNSIWARRTFGGCSRDINYVVNITFHQSKYIIAYPIHIYINKLINVGSCQSAWICKIYLWWTNISRPKDNSNQPYYAFLSEVWVVNWRNTKIGGKFILRAGNGLYLCIVEKH